MQSPSTNNEIIEVHAIVHGSVQGVGFRATVRHHATRLGLIGKTRNLPDGTVEIYAKGKPEKVIQLFQELKKEFGSEYISEISQKEIQPHHHYDGFNIVR